MDNSFLDLLQFIEEHTTFKCKKYKKRPLKRRIRVRMRALHLNDFSVYRQYLMSHPEELKRLLSILTINLSFFFRNKETFSYLAEHIFPEYRNQNGDVRFWSAGCAQGEEPYTLAITAADTSFLDRIIVYGTDIDEIALAVAEKGEYTGAAFQYTPEYIVKRYFHKHGDTYAIRDSIRKRVTFRHLDLFQKPSFGRCDLIMCRNVLIYLDREGQSTVLKTFYDHLKPNGYLVIGKVELLIGISEVKLFKVVNRTEHVYKRVEF